MFNSEQHQELTDLTDQLSNHVESLRPSYGSMPTGAGSMPAGAGFNPAAIMSILAVLGKIIMALTSAFGQPKTG